MHIPSSRAPGTPPQLLLQKPQDLTPDRSLDILFFKGRGFWVWCLETLLLWAGRKLVYLCPPDQSPTGVAGLSLLSGLPRALPRLLDRADTP